MAILLKDNKALFLHIPKTGGTWITNILDRCKLRGELLKGHRHSDFYRTFKQHNLPKDIFTFCFVRHPIEWYKSWFRYMSQFDDNYTFGDENDIIKKWHPNSMLNGLDRSTFESFIIGILKKRPGYVTEFFSWYTPLQINFIGKQENLREGLIKVLKILKYDFDEEFIRNRSKINTSPEMELQLDNKIYNLLYKSEHAGLMRYGYAKNPCKNW